MPELPPRTFGACQSPSPRALRSVKGEKESFAADLWAVQDGEHLLRRHAADYGRLSRVPARQHVPICGLHGLRYVALCCFMSRPILSDLLAFRKPSQLEPVADPRRLCKQVPIFSPSRRPISPGSTCKLPSTRRAPIRGPLTQALGSTRSRWLWCRLSSCSAPSALT